MNELPIYKWVAHIVDDKIVCCRGVFVTLGDCETCKCLSADVTNNLGRQFFPDSQLADDKPKALEILYERLHAKGVVIGDDLKRNEELRHKVAKAWNEA